MMTRVLIVAAIPFSLVHAALGQVAGGSDLGLGGSSVMWNPHPSALFLNPAELARIRQSEFGFNAFRFTGLSSFAGTSFIPSLGTLAAGIARYGPESQFAIGYAHSIGRYSAVGGGFSGYHNGEETFGFSFGGSLHLPTGGERSGLHAALSINNLSDNMKSPRFSANIGAGYWIVEDIVRVQGAFQNTPSHNYGLAGAEYLPLNWLAIQVGTRSFKEVTAGLRLTFVYGSIELAGGKAGGVFSVITSLGELAATRRDEAIDDGDQSMQDEQYFEAADHYRQAAEYDPYSVAAFQGIDSALAIVESVTSGGMEEGRSAMEKKDFVNATKSFQRVLRIDPDNDEAQSKLQEMHSRIQDYVAQLVATGDSLRNRRDVERARQTYEQALEMDPGNDPVKSRITDLKSLARESVRTILIHARSLLDRGQTDDAEKEYERVLSLEPRNTAARQGLDAVRGKRNDDLFETGKAAFDSSDYWGALNIFLDVLKNDGKHKAATGYLAETRKILLPEANNFFRSGLQYYTKDNFKAALEEWDKALQINPNHQATLEYRKRAEEKLKALERLK